MSRQFRCPVTGPVTTCRRVQRLKLHAGEKEGVCEADFGENAMSDELLTAREAAAYLKVSLAAFYAWRRRHRIPSRIDGRTLRFFKTDLVREAPPAAVVDFVELARQHARGELRRA